MTWVTVGSIELLECGSCDGTWVEAATFMNRVNFGLVSGAIVDVCKGHGTFLDRGELHQVVRFILDGGLDRTREIKRQALIEEEQRLRATLDHVLSALRESPPYAS